MSLSEEHLLFIEDATAQLDACDKSVLALDTALMAGAQPAKDDLNTLFRGVHTLKGNAGMVGCDRLVEVAHVLETLMDKLRSGTLAPTREIVDVIFSGLDTLRTLLLMFQSGTADAYDATEYLNYLHAAMSQSPAKGGRLETLFPHLTLHDPVGHAAQLDDLDAGLSRFFRLVFVLDGADAEAPLGHEAFEKLGMLGFYVGWRWLAPGRLEVAYLTRATLDIVTRFAPEQVELTEPWPDAAAPAATVAAPEPVATPAPAVEVPGAPEAGLVVEAAESSLRVGVGLLDKLMNLVGELVLTRNQILQRLAESEDPAAQAPVQRLSQLTSELQEAVMKTRMQTVGQIWDKFPRLVRDYCRSSGKQIQLVQEGADTEIDKSLLEAIKDPLTHLIRNALDHAIESPDDRVAAHKPPMGTVTLSAHHAGGHILIEIKDDGRGLNLEKIQEKALQKGLVTTEQLARMSTPEVHQLIFQPGFSTAEAVTNISGRGVGMDVVKSNIERIGGAIDIHSETGRGTAMRLRIPLTLAVMPALIIESGDQRFAMPQSAVQEVVAFGEGMQTLEHVSGSLVYRLRQELIPVVSLREALGLPQAAPTFLVVLQAGATTFGLAVDGIGDTQEIVVKSTPSFLKGLDAYAGVTIMGDGQACMILNAASLGAGIGMEQIVQAAPEAAQETATGIPGGTRQRMLLVRIGEQTYAVPMSLVSRLETMPVERLERLGDRLVLQYGDRLLNVAEVDTLLNQPTPEPSDTAQVVVIGEGERMAGLRVAEILDIVDETMLIHAVTGVKGILGAAVIGGAATQLLDVHTLLETGVRWTSQAPREMPLKRLLLVEDSSFFRTLVRSHLEAAGYVIFEAGNGEEGLQVLATQAVDVVLSDIEMPQVDGLSFIREVRAQSAFANLPAVALTSVEEPEMREAALKAGFDQFLTKYDRDAVFAALNRLQAAARPITEALR
jgi:two-component system chemotaxis sensor kinase CheA